MTKGSPKVTPTSVEGLLQYKEGYIDGLQVALELLVTFRPDEAEAYLHRAIAGDKNILKQLRSDDKKAEVEARRRSVYWYAPGRQKKVVHVTGTEENAVWAASVTGYTVTEINKFFKEADDRGFVCTVTEK